jgi:hypothetical protein
MGEPIDAGSGDHVRRLDEDIERDPGAVEENPELDLWTKPGHDGVIDASDSDPDREDLRTQIGQYVSLVKFPADASGLAAAAEKAYAPDVVVASLRQLDPDARFSSPEELWDALGLSSGPRF